MVRLIVSSFTLWIGGSKRGRSNLSGALASENTKQKGKVDSRRCDHDGNSIKRFLHQRGFFCGNTTNGLLERENVGGWVHESWMRSSLFCPNHIRTICKQHVKTRRQIAKIQDRENLLGREVPLANNCVL